MAGSVNKAILIGHLGRDPEIRSFQNGGRIASMRLATSESWRDKDTGERKERTQWHSVVIFNEPLVKLAEQYLRKGSKVYVEGQIETRKHVNEAGLERYFTEVVLRPFRGEITLLDRQDTGARGSPEDYTRTDAPRENADQTRSFGSGGGSTDLDDEIPF